MLNTTEVVKERDELTVMKRNKRIDLLERQLSEFYWPLYFRLQKDNVVWQKILDRSRKDDVLRQRVGVEIERDFILTNHDEIVRIVESKFHLARADGDLSTQLFNYI